MTPEGSKAGKRDRLMALRAPVAGTVQQLAVHTVGGVVTSAQPLLVVVLSEEALEIEATVLNKDIGFVRPGQAVTVKEESFPHTRYDYLAGKVVSVSHDAAQDEKLGLVFPRTGQVGARHVAHRRSAGSAKCRHEPECRDQGRQAKGHRLPAQPVAAAHY